MTDPLSFIREYVHKSIRSITFECVSERAMSQ